MARVCSIRIVEIMNNIIAILVCICVHLLYSTDLLLWLLRSLRVSLVTKIQLYFDFDACPYYSHMSKLGNSRLSRINSSLPHQLLIFASSMPPLMAEERRRQLILAAAYLVNVVGIATTLYSTPFYWKQLTGNNPTIPRS